MENAATPRVADSRDWWDYRPVFSVTEKGTRITGLAPGQSPGHVTTRLLVSAALCFAVWGAIGLFGSSWLCNADSPSSLSCALDVGDGWPTVVGFILFVYAALQVTVDLSERVREQFGQRRAASLFWMAPLLAGIAIGCGGAAAVAVAGASDPIWIIRQTMDGRIGTAAIAISTFMALSAALWGLVVAVRLPFALRYAHQRQATIERLRRDGYRCAGWLHLGDVCFWLGNNPELDVTVTCDSPAGKHTVAARMRTSPDRVPKDGSGVVVFTDLEGAVHIELDAYADTLFEPEQRYTPSE
jgi:hypothetical protein